MKRSLIILGGGHLGCALARGIEADPPPFVGELKIVEHNVARRELLEDSLSAFQIVGEIPLIAPDAIILIAVKPSDVEQLCFSLGEALQGSHLVISCAAGVSFAALHSMLGHPARLVRCMPNLAASCRKAITAYVAKAGETAEDTDIVERLFARVGTVVRLQSEELLHAVTAISGSGPGYLAWIAEVMERAAVDLGLPPDTSRLLVQHTFAGLAQLLLSEGVSPRTIFERVSSPNGTTVAAIRELSERGVDEALSAAIHRAVDRSRQLVRS